jgi:hypothetical protein
MSFLVSKQSPFLSTLTNLKTMARLSFRSESDFTRMVRHKAESFQMGNATIVLTAGSTWSAPGRCNTVEQPSFRDISSKHSDDPILPIPISSSKEFLGLRNQNPSGSTTPHRAGLKKPEVHGFAVPQAPSWTHPRSTDPSASTVSPGIRLSFQQTGTILTTSLR